MGPAGPASGAVVDEDDAIGYADNIRVEIGGAGGAFRPRGLSRVGVDIPTVETTSGLDTQWGTYRPGRATVPDVTIIVASGAVDDVQDWFDRVADGYPDPRDVTIEILELKSGQSAITIALFDCWPISFDRDSGTLVIKVSRTEIEGTQGPLASTVNNPAPRTHDYVVGSSVSEATLVQGGSKAIEYADSSLGTDQFQTFTPGHWTVSPLFARLDWPSVGVYQWIADVIDGTDARRDVELTSVTTQLQRTYFDAFPIRVNAFNPLLIMSNGLAPATIELTIKAERLEE